MKKIKTHGNYYAKVDGKPKLKDFQLCILYEDDDEPTLSELRKKATEMLESKEDFVKLRELKLSVDHKAIERKVYLKIGEHKERKPNTNDKKNKNNKETTKSDKPAEDEDGEIKKIMDAEKKASTMTESDEYEVRLKAKSQEIQGFATRPISELLLELDNFKELELDV